MEVIDNYTWDLGSTESLFLRVNVPGFGKLFVCGLYRPPSQSMSDFLTKLEQILAYCGSVRTVITGDFNIDFLKREVWPSRILCDLMTSYDFQNNINLPTYVSPVSNCDTSCLDHIWQNFSSDFKSFVITPNLADHYAVSSVFDWADVDQRVKMEFRDYSEANIDKFKENVDLEFEQCNPPLSDVDSYAEYLLDFLYNLINKYFPIRTKYYTKKRLKAPWLSADVVRCIDKKHLWYREMKLGMISFESYKEYNCVARSLDIAQRDYYIRKFELLGNDF